MQSLPMDRESLAVLADIAAAAVLYGNLRDREVLSADVSLADGLYEVLLHSEWMDYDCYVDAATGEVLGLQSAPVEACRLGA